MTAMDEEKPKSPKGTNVSSKQSLTRTQSQTKTALKSRADSGSDIFVTDGIISPRLSIGGGVKSLGSFSSSPLRTSLRGSSSHSLELKGSIHRRSKRFSKPVHRFSQNPSLRMSAEKAASALALQKDTKAFFEPLQLIKTVGPEEFSRIRSAPLMTGRRTQVYMVGKDAKMADTSRSQRRQAASVPTVTVPKTGLIKLTGLAYEFDNPGYYDTRKEQHSRQELQKHRDEVYGGALPPPPSDLFRGPLIRNKSIMKQVKCGQQRLQAEREQLKAKHETESAMYRTFVGGLLEFEMPEVPNLNNNLQKFLGWQDPRLFKPHNNKNNDSSISNNKTTHTNTNNRNNNNHSNNASQEYLLHREKSRSATLAQHHQAVAQLTPRSVMSEQVFPPQSPTDLYNNSNLPRSGSTAEHYLPSPLHSPRVAFVTTEFLQNKLVAAATGTTSNSRVNLAKPAHKRRGYRSPDDDVRGELQPRYLELKEGGAEGAVPGEGAEFDEDELYHTMTEYGIYQELGKTNGLYINKADDKSKNSTSLVLPELAPY